MTPVVAWLGPAAPYQAPGWSAPAGATVVNLQCTGDGTPTCGQIADAWSDVNGQHLPGLLTAGGLDPSTVGDVMLNAFSAGGSSSKRILLSPGDRARTSVVVLADGMYTTDRRADGRAMPIEGFVRFALDALSQGKLLVATSSNTPNKAYPTGSETLDATRQEIELRTGRAFQLGGSLPLPVEPVRLWTMETPTGSVILGDYQALLKHGEHVSVLNAPIWENLVKPFLSVRGGLAVAPVSYAPGIAADETFWEKAIAVLGGAALGFAAGYAVMRRLG